MGLFETFARAKPCMIMKLLREPESVWHISKLAKQSGVTFVYTSHIVARLLENGYVTVDSKGKKKFVRLTEKGMKAANSIDELMKSTEG